MRFLESFSGRAAKTLGVLVFVLCAAAAAHGQAGMIPPPAGMPDPSQVNHDRTIHFGDDMGAGSMDERRVKMMNAARQKVMLSDVDKMVRLARQLNDELAADPASLPPGERMRVAAEIEKLAKDVKEKMVYAVTLPAANSYTPFGTWPQ